MLRADGQTYEWDLGKRSLNLARHGVDFEAIRDFEWETAKVGPSPRKGEERFLALGHVGNREHSEARLAPIIQHTPCQTKRGQGT